MGLFDKLRRAKRQPLALQIVGIQLKIRPGTKPLPGPLAGAYVIAFSLAGDPKEAAKKSALAIFRMGYDVEEVIPQALHIELDRWDKYLSSTWPEFPDHFPSQAEIAEALSNGGVVFSPFAGFEPPVH